MGEFGVRPLYGGALEAEMLSRLNNMGDMLPIPDAQEVFSDPESRRSYIIELLEKSDGNNFEAMRAIFCDISEANQAAENVIIEETALDENIYFIQGKFKIDVSWVDVYLLVIRLLQHKTDLTFYIADPESSDSQVIKNMMYRFSRSFKINDRGLFV